jgi:hypothetical protein
MTITRDEVKLYCWGQGANGRTGLGHMDNVTTPQPLVGALADARVVRVAACCRHSCALAEDGCVFEFGCTDGIPAADGEGIPQLLQGGALAAGGAPVRALCTGCGGLHTDDATTPQPVVGALADARVVRIAAGWHNSCALAEYGRVFAFGLAAGIQDRSARHAAAAAGGRAVQPWAGSRILSPAGARDTQITRGCSQRRHTGGTTAARRGRRRGGRELRALQSPAAAGGGAASAGSEHGCRQGTKCKRDGQSYDDDDESGAPEEGGEDAAPLC